MVSKAHIQRKKRLKSNYNKSNWMGRLESPPNDGRKWGICVWDRCRKWTPIVVVYCVYGLCTETYCTICGRDGGSWGPLGCPCTSTKRGHNTLDERLHARGKVVASEIESGKLYGTFIVVPFKKHKKISNRRKGQKI